VSTSEGFPTRATLRPILVVDDDPSDRLFVCTTLENGRIRNAVIECDSAEYARQELRSRPLAPPVLCILDINLRGESGIQWLRWLRQQPGSFSTIPTIMLTGSSDEEDRSVASGLAALRYLQKPVSVDALLEAVHGLGLTVMTDARSGQIEFAIVE
jgi:DNA-binding response OmpR family regulator